MLALGSSMVRNYDTNTTVEERLRPLKALSKLDPSSDKAKFEIQKSVVGAEMDAESRATSTVNHRTISIKS
jgi:hypothetical protein